MHARLQDEDLVESVGGQSLDGEALEGFVDSTLARRERARKTLEHCAGVAASAYPHPLELHLRAALQGNVRSTRDFLSFDGGGDSASTLINEPRLAQLYHQHYVPVLLRALHAGDPHAIRNWQWLLQIGDGAALVQQLPPEMRDPVVLRHLAQRVSSETTGMVVSVWSEPADATAEVQQQSDLLFRRFFAESARYRDAATEEPTRPRVGTSRPSADAEADDRSDCETD